MDEFIGLPVMTPLRWVLCVAAASLIALNAGAEQPSSQHLFERIRPSVVEVLTKTRGNQGVAAAASGFLVLKNDWVVTNYHAVTEAIFEPEENELIVVTNDSKRILAKVVAVDVQHDLAILQLSFPLTASVLTLREKWPAKGEAGFSMGKPGQYQHSIVSGTFNGVIDEDTTPQIVFSGAINPGMSGGPTLDSQGLVVGVNVASSTENQLLGLAVPAQALSKLISSTSKLPPPTNTELRNGLAHQFAAYGRIQLSHMDKAKHAVRHLGPFEVRGDLSDDKECQTVRQDQSDRRYRRLEQHCVAPDGLYIMPKLYAGQISMGTYWLQGKDMSSFAMSLLIERRINDLRKVHDEDSPPGRWSCQEQRFRGTDDLPIQLHACRRPIPKLPGLYDFRFRYAPLIGGKDALVVAVGLSGFDNDTARAVLRKSIESVRHKPEPP
jgi:serine protease Do